MYDLLDRSSGLAGSRYERGVHEPGRPSWDASRLDLHGVRKCGEEVTPHSLQAGSWDGLQAGLLPRTKLFGGLRGTTFTWQSSLG